MNEKQDHSWDRKGPHANCLPLEQRLSEGQGWGGGGGAGRDSTSASTASTFGSVKPRQVLLFSLLSHPNEDVGSVLWLGLFGYTLRLPLPLPPQGAGRPASQHGLGAAEHQGTGPACVPPPALGPLLGQTTLDQGCEAPAGGMGRNLGPLQCSPCILPVYWPWILTDLIGGR